MGAHRRCTAPTVVPVYVSIRVCWAKLYMSLKKTYESKEKTCFWKKIWKKINNQHHHTVLTVVPTGVIRKRDVPSILTTYGKHFGQLYRAFDRDAIFFVFFFITVVPSLWPWRDRSCGTISAAPVTWCWILSRRKAHPRQTGGCLSHTHTHTHTHTHITSEKSTCTPNWWVPVSIKPKV